MSQSESINELAAALAKAQGEMRGAIKDAKNPFFKASYADLGSVWDACREQLSKNGLCVIQTMGPNLLITTLAHSSGQWIKSEWPILPVKNDPQGVGSAVSYARRYSLAAIVGIYQTDDDAEKAMARPTSPPSETNLVYKVPFGKFSGRSFEEIGIGDLRNYVEYIENKARTDGKGLTGTVAEFVEMAATHIGNFENS